MARRKRRQGNEAAQERMVCERCGEGIVEPGHLETIYNCCTLCIRHQSVKRYLRRYTKTPAKAAR